MKDLAKLMPSRRVHGTRLDAELEPPLPEDYDGSPLKDLSLPYLLLCAPVILVIGALMLCAMFVYAIEKLLIPFIADKIKRD